MVKRVFAVAARGIPAGSTPSTTTTSIAWPWPRPSAGSWSARSNRAPTRGRSPTACR
jgi:hypothetical protein